MFASIEVTAVFLSIVIFQCESRPDFCNPDTIQSRSYSLHNTHSKRCADCLSVKNCIRKCCAFGFYVDTSKRSELFCVRFEDDRVKSIPVYRTHTFVRDVRESDDLVIGLITGCAIVPLLNETGTYVQENGRLLYDGYYYDNSYYCVDYLNFHEVASAIVCKYAPKKSSSNLINIACMIISMPFLFITFVAYALLPDRNLHMKALMIYVMNLLLGYIFLVVLQLSNGTIETSTCKAFGYLCIFLLMSSFLWMNVICIDIWFAFSGLRGFSGTKRAENKRFLIYNAYAWGTATLITLIVVIMNEMNTGAAWYVPGIAQGQCFLALGYPELLYFYGPMAIIITINVILFAMTAFKIRAVKKETSMLKKDDSKRHSYENDKQKFNLYLKLLFAMGVNWSLEIISWAVAWKVAEAPKYIWYLTDFCNAIYGVFIFFIFVFKRSIWKLLKKRYYSFRGQTNLAHSMTTNPTRTTSYSTTSTAARDSQPGGSHTSTLLTTTTET